MQPTTTTNSYRGGGRVSSAEFRHSRRLSEAFTGLEADANRYELLLLVKRVGKAAGFTPRMIQLLDYYMAFTTAADWEQGSRPIVFQSLARTAMDLGVGERQVQKLEQRLFDAGAITWNDSGNHKRYGRRDPASGRLLFAFGVELTPLASLRGELEAKLYEKELYAREWRATKRSISALRRQIRSLLLALREEGVAAPSPQGYERTYREIAIELRSHIDLSRLRRLEGQHRDLAEEIGRAIQAGRRDRGKATASTPQSSCRRAAEYAHNQHITPVNKSCSGPPDAGLQGQLAGRSSPTDHAHELGAERVTLRQLVCGASERFRSRLPVTSRPLNWSDVVEAAHGVGRDLGISHRVWGEACGSLGRTGAALCVVLTDRAAERAERPVRRPAAYFGALVGRSLRGELRPRASLFAPRVRSGATRGLRSETEQASTDRSAASSGAAHRSRDYSARLTGTSLP